MMATSSSGRGSSMNDRETVACKGFIDERVYAIRSGSPTDATRVPAASATATEPMCTDSRKPDRRT
jgi:hypothetical protein